MDGRGRAMGRGVAWLERVSLALSVVLLALLFLLVLADVVLRAMRIEFYWGNEGGAILMAWLLFFALPVAGRKRMHIRTDFASGRLPGRMQRVLDALGQLLMLAYMLVLAWVCFELARRNFASDARSQGILRLPLHVVQAGVVAAMLLVIAAQVANVLESVRTLRDRIGGPR